MTPPMGGESGGGKPPAGGRALLLVALVLVAMNLRPAVASVSPVLETIRQDLSLSRAAAGSLTTIPVLCMSAFALAAPRLAERVGAGRGVLWGLALVGAATALRLAGGAAPALFAATFLIGAGVAVTQSLVPAVVKERFPERAVLVTGLYTVGINAGAALAAGTTAPLRSFLGGSWPDVLALWALPVAPAAVLWWACFRGERHPASTGGGASVSPPWGSGRAWLVALFFGGNSCVFWSTLTWLAPLYQDEGFAEGRAGLVLTVFAIAQTAASLVVPTLADRSRDRRPWLALSLAAVITGFLAVAIAPLAAPWAWAIVLGLGVGALFPLALTLPLDNAEDAAAAGRLSAMTFCVGYLLAAGAPAAIGALRDATGGFEAPFLALAALGSAMLVASAWFRPRHEP